MTEWESFPEKKKEGTVIKPQPEEIKTDTNEYHDALQSFLSKSKEKETESEIEEDPMERRRRTRQTDDEVIIYDPVEEEMKEKETKGNK